MTFCPSAARQRTQGGLPPISVSRLFPSSRFAISRGCRRPSASGSLLAQSASSTSCRSWAAISWWYVQTRHPTAWTTWSRAASDLRELGERASARGVRVGFKALAWARHIKTYQACLGSGARRGSQGDRPDPRQLPHVRGAGRFDRPARNSWLLHLPRPPCRRHGDPSGPSRPEPALHELPWSGRAAPAGVHGGAAGDRVQRAAVAGNLQ